MPCEPCPYALDLVTVGVHHHARPSTLADEEARVTPVQSAADLHTAAVGCTDPFEERKHQAVFFVLRSIAKPLRQQVVRMREVSVFEIELSNDGRQHLD